MMIIDMLYTGNLQVLQLEQEMAMMLGLLRSQIKQGASTFPYGMKQEIFYKLEIFVALLKGKYIFKIDSSAVMKIW